MDHRPRPRADRGQGGRRSAGCRATRTSSGAASTSPKRNMNNCRSVIAMAGGGSARPRGLFIELHDRLPPGNGIRTRALIVVSEPPRPRAPIRGRAGKVPRNARFVEDERGGHAQAQPHDNQSFHHLDRDHRLGQCPRPPGRDGCSAGGQDWRNSAEQSSCLRLPIDSAILAHYMPWYMAKPHSQLWGWHWTMGTFDPEKRENGRPTIASHYHPIIGPYDSADPDVSEYHALLMKLAGMDGVVVDWYWDELTIWTMQSIIGTQLHSSTNRPDRAGLRRLLRG